MKTDPVIEIEKTNEECQTKRNFASPFVLSFLILIFTVFISVAQYMRETQVENILSNPDTQIADCIIYETIDDIGRVTSRIYTLVVITDGSIMEINVPPQDFIAYMEDINKSLDEVRRISTPITN